MHRDTEEALKKWHNGLFAQGKLKSKEHIEIGIENFRQVLLKCSVDKILVS